MFKKVEGKILVLSDIHYPHCNEKLITHITRAENPDLLVLLGDIVTELNSGYRTFLDSLSANEVVYVKGDGDVLEGDTEVLEVENNKKKFLFFHGHQVLKERTQYSLAKTLKKLNYYLPPLGFCVLARVVKADFSRYIILGHSHALVYFHGIRCANAGTMSSVENLYNDRGYIRIVDGKIEIIRIS
ncbi:metallophosphoesterase family protein [Stygiolobus caldivivus]|uniref:Calcineurin-like phosphoesterase domain-containing protein n=1 Tax=Stygiolobus caldivivus TaxID=2824673 RepID=A0A8D5ZDX2_9CREN|nr:metallophosphoesterase family protein [Stygiolobus caldivivus]BCU69343.1 hypothetical protein KN1_06400 [Stygiolobus caldivivus]